MKFFIYCLLFLLLTVNFFGCGRYLNRSTHVLFSKPDFISAKSFIPNGISFAQEFIFDRTTLANDQLNLTKWGGFNEVIWNTKSNWKEIGLKAHLYNSYLWLFVIVDETKRVGFRISKNPQFESGFYEMSANKLFLKSEAFTSALDFSAKNVMDIKLIYQNGQLALMIDDKIFFEKPIDLKNKLFSFRSSNVGQVVIDDLYMYNKDGTQLFEDFSPRSQIVNGLLALLFQAMLAGTFVIILKRTEFNLNQICGFALVCTTNLVFWVWLDETKLSQRYYNVTSDAWSGHLSVNADVALEVARKHVLKSIYGIAMQKQNSFILDFKDYTYSFVIPENIKQIPEFAKLLFHLNGLESNLLETRMKFIEQNTKLTLLKDFSELAGRDNQFQKIVFMGSSQTYGGGAASMETIFSSQVVNELIKCSKRPVASVNISSPGDRIEYFLRTYKKLVQFWKPTLLVVSLGANEHDPDVFEESLKQIISWNAEIGAKTVLIKESNTLEIGKNNFASQYEVLERLGRKYSLPVLNLDAFINSTEIYDKGILWMDQAHFDRAGHDLTAVWLLAELKKYKVAGCW
ncbi:SGNH/GDSL hydrolase family protein [bacterium]|nr:SGNH/GDSL hydrolase family protein [bacterium]